LASKSYEQKTIPLDRILLDTENPRHPKFGTQEEAVAYLCAQEKIDILADDIVYFQGLIPAQTPIVIPSEDRPGYFIVLEGNRRICALKLLSNPDLAPQNYRQKFQQLKAKMSGTSEIEVIVTTDPALAKEWRRRIQGGEQGGKGPRSWGAEEKIRDNQNHPKRSTLDLLDQAQRQGFINSQHRRGKISVLDRYLSNRKFRAALGYQKNEQGIGTHIYPKEDFHARLKKVMEDLRDRKFIAQAKTKDIEEYADNLAQQVQISGEQIAPVQIDPSPPPSLPQESQNSVPASSRKRNRLPREERISKLLKNLDNEKMETLYESLCKIVLHDKNTPLLTVGVSIFLETLAKNAFPEKPNTRTFREIYDNNRIKGLLDMPSNDKSHKAVRNTLDQIDKESNNIKHHKTAAHYNPNQLKTYMETLTPLIEASIKKAIKEKSGQT